MKKMIFGSLFAAFMVVIFSGCGNNNGNCPSGTTYVNGVCSTSALAYQTPGTYPTGYPTNGVYPTGYPTNGVYPQTGYPYTNGMYPNGCTPGSVMRVIPQTGQQGCLPICPVNPMLGCMYGVGQCMNGYGCI